MKTRFQQQHKSIKSVHPAKPKLKTAFKSAKVRKADRQRQKRIELAASPAGQLIDLIQRDGITTVLGRLFSGDLQGRDGGTITRLQALTAFDRNKAFRRFASNLWRAEDDGTHEWIPCTYLNMIVRKAVVSADFRYLALAYRMRSRTQDLIFKPDAHNRITVNSVAHTVLQAHPGGLAFRVPAAGPLVNVPAGHGYADGNRLTAGQQGFHTAIIQSLANVNSPAALVAALQALHTAWCWNGAFPVNGIANASTLWPYYHEHANTVQIRDPAVAAPAVIAYAQNAFNAVAADFNQWDALARNAGRRNRVDWT